MKKALSLLLVLTLILTLPLASAEEKITLKVAYFGTAYVMDENGNDRLCLLYTSRCV